jgi:hypothetical protein
VTIEDELKTNKANFGKVLAVDLEAETISLSNTWNSHGMNDWDLNRLQPHRTRYNRIHRPVQ